MQRQIRNLEDDDLPQTARRQIIDRIGHLEAAINAKQVMAEAMSAEESSRAVRPEDIYRALETLPLADRLGDLPQAAVRRLYDALDLKIHYHPGDRAIDLDVTLARAIPGCEPPDPDGRALLVCLVPRVGFEPTLSEV